VDCSGRHLTPAGDRGKVETPQGKARGGLTSSPGNLMPGAERNGPCFKLQTHEKFTFLGVILIQRVKPRKLTAIPRKSTPYFMSRRATNFVNRALQNTFIVFTSAF
jgi:hypothetical protein